jgi:hypothetical protein
MRVMVSDMVDVYGEGGESIAAQHNTGQDNTPYYLSHHTISHHTTPMSADFSFATRPSHKAIVLLPCEGVLRACGLCEVVVSEG